MPLIFQRLLLSWIRVTVASVVRPEALLKVTVVEAVFPVGETVR